MNKDVSACLMSTFSACVPSLVWPTHFMLDSDARSGPQKKSESRAQALTQNPAAVIAACIGHAEESQLVLAEALASVELHRTHSLLQNEQVAQQVMHLITTRSPFLKFLTSAPASSMTPSGRKRSAKLLHTS